MKKKTISVVGKGTAGSQAIIHFYRFLPENTELVWYFDPNKPAQSVGEGSTIELARNLYHNMNFFGSDLKKVNGTFKTGIYKENWGRTGAPFFHNFVPPFAAYHFSATELQKYIYDFMKDKIKIVEEDVDYKKIDSDFVLNASGVSKNFDDFHTSKYIPVNSAYVVQCNWDIPRFDYTLAIAGKHGWIFGIPLQNRCSIGYIYNNEISTEEDIAEDIQKIFKDYNLTPSSEPNKLSFKNYYRKNNYESNGKISHTGNASFFLEPMEATSIATMDKIQRASYDIFTGQKTVSQANAEYLKLMNQTELVLMMHYAAGSKFKTDFWEYAQDLGIKKFKDSSNDLEFNKMYKIAKEIKEMRFAHTVNDTMEYGPWWSGSFSQNLRGLDLFDTLDKIF